MARYWVGGTGNWSDDTNHWATTSGGLPSAGNLPTSSDDVIFDTLSHTTNYTVTVNSSQVCRDLTMGAPLTNKVTWAGSSALAIWGSVNLSGGTAGITRSYTGTITFSATSSKTLTFNGITMNSTTVFDGVSGTWTNQDAWNNSSKRITLTNGTWDMNGKTISFNDMSSSNSNVRVITMGAATVNLSGAGGKVWNCATSTNLTINAGTSTINMSGLASQFSGGAKTYYTVNFTGGGYKVITQSNTFTNLNVTGTAAVQNSLSIPATQTITTLLTLAGNSQVYRLFVKSSTFGTSRTFTAASVSLTNVDFQDITAAGAAAPFSGTSLGDCTHNSNITFTGAVTRYWVGNGGGWTNTARWSTSSGGASGASMPLAQDTVIFDSNSITSGSQTVTADPQSLGKSISFSALGANVPTFAAAAATTENWIFDSLTLKSGMTMSGTGNLYFCNRSLSSTLTTAAVTITTFLNINCVSGTVTLQDNMTLTTSGMQINFGTFDANNKDVTQPSFNCDNGNTRTLNMGTGTWTINGTGLCFTFANTTGLTLNPSTSTIKFTDASSSSKTFNTGGATFANLWFTGAGTGAMIFQGSPTFTNFKVDTQPKTVQFTNGITVTIASFTCTGTAGNLITLQPVSGSWTIRSSSAYISGDYLSISGSTATGGATFYAGANSTNGGSNTNWQFVAPPSLIKRQKGFAIG